MKNIQIIDGAQNCTFSIFQAEDEEFLALFPEPGQDIQFAEDIPQLASADRRLKHSNIYGPGRSRSDWPSAFTGPSFSNFPGIAAPIPQGEKTRSILHRSVPLNEICFVIPTPFAIDSRKTRQAVLFREKGPKSFSPLCKLQHLPYQGKFDAGGETRVFGPFFTTVRSNLRIDSTGCQIPSYPDECLERRVLILSDLFEKVTENNCSNV